jgi:hypothetical protein
MNTAIRTRRNESPARWMKAADRAIAEGVEVRQCAGSGLWIATSGTDSGAAYELEVYGAVAAGCSCLAGMNEDPVCKHRAAFYLLVGAIVLSPEPPTPAAPEVEVVEVIEVELRPCFYCEGRGADNCGWTDRGVWVSNWLTCRHCNGTGKLPLPRRAA